MTKHVRRVLRMVPLAIGAALLGAVSAPGNGVLAQGATVAISPPDATVACNQNITVSVMINNVTNLYGVDFKISYDPAIVEVVDADPGNPGTQIQQGTFPDVTGGQGLIRLIRWMSERVSSATPPH
jgi:hypothetical protein